MNPELKSRSRFNHIHASVVSARSSTRLQKQVDAIDIQLARNHCRC